MRSVTIFPVFGGLCDSENLVGSAHKHPMRPPAANMGPLRLIESCDLRSQGTLAAGLKMVTLVMRSFFFMIDETT